MSTAALRRELEGWRARLAWELAQELKADQSASGDRVERLVRELAFVQNALEGAEAVTPESRSAA